MAYHFKLEALRWYRQHQEEEHQKELAAAVRRRDAAESVVNELLQRRRATEAEFQTERDNNTAGNHFIIYVRYLQRLAGQIEEQRGRLALLEKAVEEKRESLLEAVKKRKTLEKLKENGFKQYLAQLNQEELKFINEIAINRFGLSRR